MLGMPGLKKSQVAKHTFLISMCLNDEECNKVLEDLENLAKYCLFRKDISFDNLPSGRAASSAVGVNIENQKFICDFFNKHLGHSQDIVVGEKVKSPPMEKQRIEALRQSLKKHSKVTRIPKEVKQKLLDPKTNVPQVPIRFQAHKLEVFEEKDTLVQLDVVGNLFDGFKKRMITLNLQFFERNVRDGFFGPNAKLCLEVISFFIGRQQVDGTFIDPYFNLQETRYMDMRNKQREHIFGEVNLAIWDGLTDCPYYYILISGINNGNGHGYFSINENGQIVLDDKFKDSLYAPFIASCMHMVLLWWKIFDPRFKKKTIVEAIEEICNDIFQKAVQLILSKLKMPIAHISEYGIPDNALTILKNLEILITRRFSGNQKYISILDLIKEEKLKIVHAQKYLYELREERTEIDQKDNNLPNLGHFGVNVIAAAKHAAGQSKIVEQSRERHKKNTKLQNFLRVFGKDIPEKNSTSSTSSTREPSRASSKFPRRQSKKKSTSSKREPSRASSKFPSRQSMKHSKNSSNENTQKKKRRMIDSKNSYNLEEEYSNAIDRIVDLEAILSTERETIKKLEAKLRSLRNADA